MNIKNNLMKFAGKALTAAAFAATLALAACSDVEYPETPYSEKVSALTYTQDGRDVILSWTLPQGDVSGVRIIANNSEETDLEGAVTTYTIKRATTGSEQTYTVKAMYANGLVSEGVSIRFTLDEIPSKIGCLIAYTDASLVEDDDELAAVEWFSNNVTDGEILTPAAVAEGISADNYSVVWIPIDRVGIGVGWENLPSTLVSDEVIAALTAYVKEGGNLLLTNHATQLVVPIGRIESTYAPGTFGDGTGGTGTDVWTFNAYIGYGMMTSYDHRSHTIFSGLTVDTTSYSYETYPLIGPGIREDHNCLWDLNSYGFTDSNTVLAFETATDSTVLGTWGQVVDYAVAGIVDFAPTDDYLGRVLAIGLAAYEWNQNSGANIYQSNIELLTSNCLNYLK